MKARLSLTLVLLAACSDAALPTGGGPPDPIVQEPPAPPQPPSDPDPLGMIRSVYVLKLVDGKPLPISPSPTGAGKWDYGGGVVELTEGTLTFYHNGTFTDAWTHRSSLTLLPYREEFSAPYLELSDGTLVMRYGTIAKVTGNELTWTWAPDLDVVLTYTR